MFQTRFYSHADATKLVAEDPWCIEITGKGRDEDGTYWVVSRVRSFDLVDQCEDGHLCQLRDEYATEVMQRWMLEDSNPAEAELDMLQDHRVYLFPEAGYCWPFPLEQRA